VLKNKKKFNLEKYTDRGSIHFKNPQKTKAQKNNKEVFI